MSAKIRISYEYHPELLDVLTKLGKSVAKVKQQQPKGKYRLAYIELKPLRREEEPDILEQ